MIITNDPFPSGVHLNDVSLISPVLAGGALLGYVANLAHHVDVGGGAPASIGAFREVFQEGVIIPPVKVVEGGRIVDDVFALILAQIRSKHETAGDFRAQIAANATGRAEARGARRPARARDDRRGDARAARLHRAAHARRARRAARTASTRRRARSTPTATADEPVRLRARVEISADGRAASTSTGSDPQRRAPVNSTYAQTFSACAYAFKCLIDPDLPVNDGFYRLVRRRRADGQRDELHLAVAGRRRLGDADAARRRDLPRAPAGAADRAARRDEGDDVPCGLRRRSTPSRASTSASSRRSAGGYGGRHASDGPDAVQTHGQNTENAPVEETEANYPVRIARLALVEDSDGAGPVPRRARAAQGLPLRPADDLHRARRPHERRGRRARSAGSTGRVAEYVLVRDGEETRLGGEGDGRDSRRATSSATAPAAAAATARPPSATPSGCCATCSRRR